MPDSPDPQSPQAIYFKRLFFLALASLRMSLWMLATWVRLV